MVLKTLHVFVICTNGSLIYLSTFLHLWTNCYFAIYGLCCYYFVALFSLQCYSAI